MDVDGCVLAAGRAVLDLVERDWQPLSTVELDQRLDQAVEDVLEADLIHKVKRTSESPSRNDAATASSTNVSPLSALTQYVTARLRDFQSRNRLTGRARLSLSQTVPLCLTLLSSRVSYRTLSRLYRLEKGNIHRIFFFFCKCVNTLRDEYIRWPRGKVLLLLEHDERVVEGRHIPRVLGVLGHTRIPIRIPSRKDSAEPEVKRTKKTEERNVSWLHLELVCDRMGRLIHCRIGKTRDADRGGALGSQLKRESHPMPPDSVLVARAGYPLTTCILTPYPGRGGTREEPFNATLEPHFHILDRAVAGLTGRFRRL
uniref:DDE Tnp4 domain-containing protein n=1 Tax=Hippocampus comes TaxID=109280 RepID=A0A3Q2XED8_HIPCM